MSQPIFPQIASKIGFSNFWMVTAKGPNPLSFNCKCPLLSTFGHCRPLTTKAANSRRRSIGLQDKSHDGPMAILLLLCGRQEFKNGFLEDEQFGFGFNGFGRLKMRTIERFFEGIKMRADLGEKEGTHTLISRRGPVANRGSRKG